MSDFDRQCFPSTDSNSTITEEDNNGSLWLSPIIATCTSSAYQVQVPSLSATGKKWQTFYLFTKTKIRKKLRFRGREYVMEILWSNHVGCLSQLVVQCHQWMSSFTEGLYILKVQGKFVICWICLWSVSIN